MLFVISQLLSVVQTAREFSIVPLLVSNVIGILINKNVVFLKRIILVQIK